MAESFLGSRDMVYERANYRLAIPSNGQSRRDLFCFVRETSYADFHLRNNILSSKITLNYFGMQRPQKILREAKNLPSACFDKGGSMTYTNIGLECESASLLVPKFTIK